MRANNIWCPLIIWLTRLIDFLARVGLVVTGIVLHIAAVIILLRGPRKLRVLTFASSVLLLIVLNSDSLALVL